MANTEVKEYSNGEVTIVWKPKLCIHSANCVNGLPSVFNLDEKPWINAKGADSPDIMATVDKCPSGALTYYKNSEKAQAAAKDSGFEVMALKNGPLLVKGDFEIKNSNGDTISCSGSTALCRCGESKKKPYCDGSHNAAGFEG